MLPQDEPRVNLGMLSPLMNVENWSERILSEDMIGRRSRVRRLYVRSMIFQVLRCSAESIAKTQPAEVAGTRCLEVKTLSAALLLSICDFPSAAEVASE